MQDKITEIKLSEAIAQRLSLEHEGVAKANNVVRSILELLEYELAKLASEEEKAQRQIAFNRIIDSSAKFCEELERLLGENAALPRNLAEAIDRYTAVCSCYENYARALEEVSLLHPSATLESLIRKSVIPLGIAILLGGLLTILFFATGLGALTVPVFLAVLGAVILLSGLIGYGVNRAVAGRGNRLPPTASPFGFFGFFAHERELILDYAYTLKKNAQDSKNHYKFFLETYKKPQEQDSSLLNVSYSNRSNENLLFDDDDAFENLCTGTLLPLYTSVRNSLHDNTDFDILAKGLKLRYDNGISLQMLQHDLERAWQFWDKDDRFEAICAACGVCACRISEREWQEWKNQFNNYYQTHNNNSNFRSQQKSPFVFIKDEVRHFILVEGKNPYEILGIQENATQAEIKAAFRKIALETHPDKTGNTERVERFRNATTAFNFLGSQETRSNINSYYSTEYGSDELMAACN